MSQSEQQLRNLWKLREYISETISHWVPYKNDISVTISKVPAFLREIDAIVSERYPAATGLHGSIYVCHPSAGAGICG